MVRNLNDVATMPGYAETPNKLGGIEDEAQGEPVLNDMDTGALFNQLTKLNLMPKKVNFTPNEKKSGSKNSDDLLCMVAATYESPKIPEGSYRGTQLALTKVYDLIEQRFMSFTDITGVEPILPIGVSRVDKKAFFAFTKSKPGDSDFPPHLDMGLNKTWPDIGDEDPNQRSTMSPFGLFDPSYLIQLKMIMSGVIPNFITKVGTPDKGNTIAEVEKYNRDRIEAEKKRWLKYGYVQDIFNRPNVGELEDWYSDDRFAQQQFTGTNPTTLLPASLSWVRHFIRAATQPEDKAAKDIITAISEGHSESLYIQDYSYFRDSAGFTDREAEIKMSPEKGSPRYGCAAVSLFYLDDEGKLHPLAIIPDWRGCSGATVTIYNRELFKRVDLLTGREKSRSPQEKRIDEANDWPWRYAKTCVQTSDWFRHEVTVHLTRTHLVEETVIVSANRQFENDHPVFQILRPHWQKTLALNQSARTVLVPSVILEIVGFSKKEALKFIRKEYDDFDFQNSYVPTDLRNRGFPPEKLDSKKFHNYSYARCINSMWGKIRTYVTEMLSLYYPSAYADSLVKQDKSIEKWWKEMQSPSGADMRSFPEIDTFEKLVDCVTMCIHIASPQHTAVNYLQDYYQDFVINKPSCLFTPPPTSLNSLLAYTEEDLVKALPINQTREWLLSSHVPYLLSFKPDEQKETLFGYVTTARALAQSSGNNELYGVLDRFFNALKDSDKEFQDYANEKWDAKDIPYTVLKPKYNAVSILI
ncbi:hypothetical protein N7478_011547 [Penicillium angulare]|uniref:uncharacterized protein n=1 Tax=Penicillium angulare TaxID=116970 RepID=UPI0025406070|nr:uncharacterized protein N7478_011547 [Penicillium angulare]KAJ5263942.1 hypothetical protein N7478_011547 [Penicillium angulare]